MRANDGVVVDVDVVNEFVVVDVVSECKLWVYVVKMWVCVV